MITYVVCDLFESPAQVLVNTVNTVGVMGKGIAKDFKRIYPEMFRQYQRICERGSFDIGGLWLYKTPNKWVLNFPTKRHWRQPSQPEYIEAGLKKFVDTYHLHGITSISFPMLGCGNGELDWQTQVQPLMEGYLKKVPIRAFVHLLDRQDPYRPEHRNTSIMKDWLRGEPDSLAFGEVWDDLCDMADHGRNIVSLADRRVFSVAVSEGGRGLTIESGDQTYGIPEEAFQELWQQLRQAGFISGKHLPYGLDQRSQYVISLMGELPYVVPVVIGHDYADLSRESIGLRLALPAREPDPPLFATARSLELR